MVRRSRYRSSLLQNIVARWPGRQRLGIYAFMPVFFMLGAALEFSMVNWFAGSHKYNFYTTFKRRAARNKALEQLELEEAA